VIDIVHMIDVAFRGGTLPCVPCNCPPYPATCP
jgi:hypothetical protein